MDLTSHTSRESFSDGLFIVIGGDVVAKGGLLSSSSDGYHIPLLLRADEGAGLHAGHVCRVGASQPAGGGKRVLASEMRRKKSV